MERLTFPSLIIMLLFALPLPATPADPPLPARIMAAQMEMAAQPLWPGYEPLSIPAAIYDGARTYLYGHPAPPTGFTPLADQPEVMVYDGRHEVIRANTSVDLNGVRTATLMISPPKNEGQEQSPQDYAAVVLHEKFHVFQGTHHPDWQANEASLFVYPATDADLLADRRLETEALRRAVGSEGDAPAAAWARAALDLRRQRYEKLDEALATYERETELVEGTAFYIEYQAAGRGPLEGAPAGGFAPADVRRRAYSTGRWLALLLDRFSPEWKASLEKEKVYLDVLLAPVLAGKTAESPADFSATEMAAATRQARADAAQLVTEKITRRQEFLEQSGYRIVVEAASPLWPAGFDPMNVLALPDNEVLHKRMLMLKNEHGSLEIMDHHALTAGAGAHPLFNGVRRVVVTGLATEPTVTEEEGTTRVTATGFTATFHCAEVTREGATTRITIR
ncbi:MAG: hypothetical protein JXQ27_12690 [Acidobacteria bacterium]|nr:hypothetical protein [Acidobacteriota bacterium]